MTKKSKNNLISPEYGKFLTEIKEKIKKSQQKAAVAVNQELIKLYWEIGSFINQKKEEAGWGSKTIEKLAKDLKEEFSNMKGFSLRNLQYMVTFSRKYPDFPITQQLAAQIPWGHNMLLMDRIKDLDTRIWYIKNAIENGWSRNVLLHWIDSELYERQGKTINNFKNTLPASQSDLACETLKDPYNFDFLTLREKFDEKELEEGLLDHIQKFLLELGAGFAFVGRQHQLTVGGQDFFIDLLFYHLKLRCFVVVELKVKDFTPKDVGQINFYLSVADDLLRHPGDNPTIGILLCKIKNKVVAEYALRDVNKPIGIAEYETQLTESLPKDFKGSLPTIEEIEEELKEESK